MFPLMFSLVFLIHIHRQLELQDSVSSLLKCSPCRVEIARKDLVQQCWSKVCKTRCKIYLGRPPARWCCIEEVSLIHQDTGFGFHLSSTHTNSLPELTFGAGIAEIWDNRYYPVLLPSHSYTASASFPCHQIKSKCHKQWKHSRYSQDCPRREQSWPGCAERHIPGTAHGKSWQILPQAKLDIMDG